MSAVVVLVGLDHNVQVPRGTQACLSLAEGQFLVLLPTAMQCLCAVTGTDISQSRDEFPNSVTLVGAGKFAIAVILLLFACIPYASVMCPKSM